MILKNIITFLSLIFIQSALIASPTWEKFKGTYPPGSLWVGMQEVLPDKTIQEYVICRAEHKEIMIPGRTSGSECLVSYKGDVIKFKEFEVFKHNNSVKFAKLQSLDTPPKNALSAGGTMSNLLYICTGRYKNLWLAGTLNESGCKIAYRNKEKIIKESIYILIKK